MMLTMTHSLIFFLLGTVVDGLDDGRVMSGWDSVAKSRDGRNSIRHHTHKYAKTKRHQVEVGGSDKSKIDENMIAKVIREVEDMMKKIMGQ